MATAADGPGRTRVLGSSRHGSAMTTESSAGSAFVGRGLLGVRASGGVRTAERLVVSVVWVAVVTWGVGFSVLAADRHEAFLSHRFDLGNMVQAVWSTAHGRFLEVTTTDGAQLTRLGVHVDPLLALFAPLWWVWPSPVMLTTVQALALASGALPVFWLARKHADDARAGLCLALAYLFYPSVQWNALNDFHPAVLGIPLILFFVWFLDEDRLVLAGLFAVLAALAKEDVALALAGIGVWYAVRRGRRLAGGGIALLAVGWTVLALYVVIPRFSGGPSPFYDRLGSVGGSPTGVVKTLFDDPVRLWHAATTGSDLRYLLLLLVPLLGLWALEPMLALAASPALALNLLSNFGPMTSVEYQYVSMIVACLFAASAIGIARLPARTAFVASLAALGSVILFSVGGPIAVGTFGEQARPSDAEIAAMRRAIALIPADAAVSASNKIGAHLSERRRIYSFPLRDHADWVIVNESDPSGEVNPAGEARNPFVYRRELEELGRDPTWRRVFAQGDVLVYARQ
jgi:uncharacterized membrane protein